MDLTSNSNNIEHTAQLIMDAFRHYNLKDGEVLTSEDMQAYLEAHSEHQHYKDTLTEAEFHLSKTAYAIPDPMGLRLTQVGYEALQENRPV